MSIQKLQASSIWKFTEPTALCTPHGKQKLFRAAPRLLSRVELFKLFSGPPKLAINCEVRFRPCIDIHKGKVKQIVGSTLQDSTEEDPNLITNFVSDKSATEYAKMYRNDGLTGGHVIMLGADPLSISAAIEALHAYPKDRYAIVTDRWQKFSDVYNDQKVLDILANYADEFLVHGVDVEGKKLGIDEELVALLGKYSPIPVTYAGGVTCIFYLERIKIAGMGHVDVTVGSALDIFGGNFAYKDVVNWHSQQKALTV